MTQAVTPGSLRTNNSMTNSSGDGSGAVTKKRAATELEARAPLLTKITHGFVPLSLLVNRLVQDSFNELQVMIESISSSTMSSEDKKARIVKYAVNTRKQFIKLLVLTMWSNDADAVSDVIDLKAWLDNQFRVFDGMVTVLCDIRKTTGRARIPNPDLATAVEVLSTGRPKTNMIKRYVPPPDLTSAEILKILRNINALLSIRLGLHEKLPPHFRDYKIASGRATFTAPDEFEVDLSIGDESPESQLYVIDVRPMFEPAIRPLPPSVFQQIEARGNQILAESGLEGIYDFLHDYFLTSKIQILLRQTHEMRRGRWTENLEIQQHKRTLVVQYWPHRMAEKSWIEVGVKRGMGQAPSRLGIRWMRDGTEIKDFEVPVDVANLSAETLVKTTIAMHTKYMLTTLRENLFKWPLFAAPGVVTLATHPLDPFEFYLRIQLTPSRVCRVLVEPITGRYALQKPSERTAKMEYEMNNRPANAADLLLRFKNIAMQEEVEQRARCMGWEILKSLNIRAEELKQNFPPNSRYMLYMRRKGWCKDWIVTFVQQDTGESWWATEIQEQPSQWSISAAIKIPMKGGTNATYRFLENLEKMAAGFISHFVNSRYLEQQGTHHRFRPSKVIGTAHSSSIQIPDLYVQFSSLIKASWGLDVLRITFLGLAAQEGHCALIVLGRTKEPMTQLSSTNIAAEESDVSFHPLSGSYAIRFVVAVGIPFIPQVVEKLHRIERLISFVTIIRKFRLNCLHVSLGRVVFRYSDVPELSAEISFTGEMEMKLILPRNSPHIRLQQMLQNTLNSTGLETVIKALFATQPLMLAFDTVEANLPPETTMDQFWIVTRNVDWFRIEYRSKNYALDVRLRHRRSVLYWYFCDPAAAAHAPLPFERRIREDIKRVWNEEGDGWEGLKTGAAAELRAVGELLKRCHEVVWNAAAPKPLPPQSQQQQQQQQQQQNVQGLASMGRPNNAVGR